MKPTIKLDVNQWSYKDFNRFMASTLGEEDPNLKFELADKIIVSWSYDTPVDEGVEALPSLNESLQVIAAIYKSINDFTETIDIDGVEVDLSKWNLKRYRRFNDIRKEGDYHKIERMLHEVAKVVGSNPEKPLTALEGARMMRAVSEAITNAMQGKV